MDTNVWCDDRIDGEEAVMVQGMLIVEDESSSHPPGVGESTSLKGARNGNISQPASWDMDVRLSVRQ